MAAVKICGITDAAGIRAAAAAGVDAIGLNLVPGTPRALHLDEAADLARLARELRSAAAPLRIVAITADATPDATGRAPPRRRSGRRPAVRRRSRRRPWPRSREPTWKVLHVPRDPGGDPAAAARAVIERGRAYLNAGAEALLLDTAGGPHPGGTGQRADESVARLVARELPITLAGGLTPANVAERAARHSRDRRRRRQRRGACPAFPASARGRTRSRLRSSRSVPAPRGSIGRPGPLVPTPVDPGLLDADDRGRWGPTREFGGRYVPETLMAAVRRLEEAWTELRSDPRYWAELRELLERYAGRPTPLYRADRLAAETLADVARLAPAAAEHLRGLRLYLKREDLAHTGAHKINNALGQALLTRRLGKTRVIAETGAGQHGVATATACALLGLPCVVYMGAEDIARQRPNVLRMDALGAEVRIGHAAAARRSRTRSTRRCATGSPTSRRPTTSSARRWGRIRTRRSCATCSGRSATRRPRRSGPSRDACRTS